jgi:hypothetical protein
MKLVLFALFFPLFCFAQNGQKKFADGVVDSVPGTSVVLKNYEVIFQKVYTSKLTADELGNQLFALLSTTKGFRFDRRVSPDGDQLIGRLVRYAVDAQRYNGYTVFGMAGILSYPADASVVVSIKDFKYRVTVSELSFNHMETATKGEFRDVKLSDYITKKNRSRFATGKSDLKIVRAIDQDLSNKFDLQKSNLSDDF